MNKKENTTGIFVASVLLSENQWNIKKLINDCKDDWDIDIRNRKCITGRVISPNDRLATGDYNKKK